jgi:BACON domain-containing protein
VACKYTVSPTKLSFKDAGGSGSVTVSAGSGCAWTATSNATWIAITLGASGSGAGGVTFTVAPNNDPHKDDKGKKRQGTITVAAQTVTITQGED